ncbi:unnamed protein product [Closterium sp. NIES-53]
MATIVVLAVDVDGRPFMFKLWLANLHRHLRRFVRDCVSLLEHTSGSPQAPTAPTEPGADAGEDVQCWSRVDRLAYTQWTERNACDSKDGISLFDLTSGASAAPAADANSTVRSHWTTRDAAARLAVRSHLPSTERAHFSQYKSEKTLYDAVVARYSSPATDAFSRLMLSYLFPDLAAFATVADLITHLRTSDIRYRASLPAEC